MIKDKNVTGLMGTEQAKALLIKTAWIPHGLFAMSKTGLEG